jgi:hypothetical protein
MEDTLSIDERLCIDQDAPSDGWTQINTKVARHTASMIFNTQLSAKQARQAAYRRSMSID